MSKLKLFLLGSPQLEIDGAPIELERRKAMALLAYLAVTEKSHSRDSLATLFWPEADQRKARTTLRHHIWSLNKALGDGWLEISRETIETVANPDLWVDVNQFWYELAACQTHDHNRAAICPDCLPHLREAVSLYRDDFLTGFTLRDSPQFDEWQRFQTEELRRELTEALERLVRGQSAQEDFKGAIPYARRWLALDPLHEPAHRQLMELYARVGQRAAALYQYNECEQILQEELGVPPSLETTALAERIRLETDGQQGQLIKSYELQELIGAGGFGEVYRAYQPQVRREVAIKAILPQFANQPEFIRRFEAEAHMVAQLEHPHIVPLYDYWREPDGAYLVMRWLRGGSLEDTLKSGPWSPEATVQLLDQIAAALILAHQRGIIHRDLKPANILLDEGGNVYLTDFGIATAVTAPRSASQTQAGVVLGSPAYMSPEAANDEPLTPQTDIYSLGVMLFEILTGQHPFPDTTPPMMLVKHLSEPLPPLQLPNPDLSAALNEVIQQATAKKPADRYTDTISLAIDFRRALGSEQVPVTVLPDEGTPLLVPNPYKGLHAFQEGDAADFFGREALVERLLVHLMLNIPSKRQPSISQPFQSPHLQNFLAIVGPSGSGKSSLVKAGLIPALRRNAIPGSKDWFIVEMTPGPHPLEELEAALLRITINPPPALLDQLQADERGLRRAVKRILPDDETELLLVIDQFEEVFTLVEDEAVRSHLLDSLHVAVTEPDSRLRVVITLRADFYDRPLLYEGFGDLLRQRMETVLPLSSEELEQAIAGPAERVGATLETGMVPLVIANVQEQPGTLPLMQYALTELFERRQGRLLTIEAYQANDGVMGALARRADELYTDLNDTGRATTRRLFLRLVTLGEGVEDTRRRVLRSELEAFGGDEDQRNGQFKNPKSKIQNVIDTFGQYRLLTFDRDPVTRGPTVEVAHEALIREWDRLQQWLDEDREFLFWQQRLRAGLHQWETSDYDEGALLRGAPLAEAENWLNQRGADLNEAERDFIQTSLARRQRQAAEEEVRLQRELETAQKMAEEAEARRQAEKQHAQEAEARAQEQSQSARRLRWLAMGLAVFLLAAIAATWFALTQRNVAQRNAAESQNWALITGSQAAVANGNTDQAVALAMQAVTLDPGSARAQAALSEAAYEPGTIRRFVGHTGGIHDIALSPDGRTALSGSVDKTVMVWDIQTGQMIRRFEGHTDEVRAVAISPDGRTALSGSHDKTLMLWDIQTGQMIRRFEGHTDQVWTVAISPDGRTALSGGVGKTLILWDIQIGQMIRRFEGHTDNVESVKFSPDGHTALSGSHDQTLILWDIESGQIIRRFEGHSGGVLNVAISPDGRSALSGGSEDTTIILWDIETGQIIRRFAAMTWVRYITFSPDGQRALAGGDDTSLTSWDLATGQPITELVGHELSVEGVVFSPDGRTALTGSFDGTLRLWDLEGGQVIRRFTGLTGRGFVARNPAEQGRTALIGGYDGATIWDLQTGNKIRHFASPRRVPWVAYSPDGQTALMAIGEWEDEPGDVVLWDVETGREIRRFVGHPAGVAAVAFSPDGQTAISTGGQGAIILWDVATGQEIRRFRGHEGDDWGDIAFTVDFSPDGRTLLTGFGQGKVVLWDVASGQEIRQLVGHIGVPDGVLFSPDGQHAFSAGWDNSAIYWDLADGSIIHRLTDHSTAILALALSPDGRFGMAGSADYTTLWDLQTGEVIRRYPGLSDEVFNTPFSPDGREVIVLPTDENLALWRIDASLDELVTWTKNNRYIPELTCEQRALYKLEPLCPEEAEEAVQAESQ